MAVRPSKLTRKAGDTNRAAVRVAKKSRATVVPMDTPRNAILKTAAHLFSTTGYSGTTMADIADAVGIRSPSLYYHFTDKGNILEAIADLTLEDALSDSKVLLTERGVSPPKLLYRLIHDVVFRLCDSEYELTCLFDPAFYRPEFRTANEKLVRWLKDVEALIKEGMDQGVFETQNLRMAGHLVRGIVIIAIKKIGGRVRVSPAEMAVGVARFAVRGLLASGHDLDSILEA